jgi:DNA-binding winged helix-turn-helix (wHTH) protein/tetratricopeptide (TPR) repeat protein
MEAVRTVRFDGWSLDRASGDLTRDGQSTRLAQQPLRVLLELTDNAGLVVTRETLVKALWPKGIVDFDNSLNGIVRRLRVVLGDDSEAPRYIETLPRIGYRFIGRLESAPDHVPSGPMPGRQPWRRIGAWETTIAVAALASVLGIGGWWLWGTVPAESSAERALVPPRTTSQRAHSYYLDGIYQASRRDIDGTTLAIAAFENALREDSGYAEAWAALSSTLIGAAVNEVGPVRPLLERAQDAAERAVVLDAALPRAHAALGRTLMFRRDYAGAERALAKALALNGHDAVAWSGVAVLRAFQGRIDEALAALRRARELEPTRPLFNNLYGSMLYYARRHDEAIAYLTPILDAEPRFNEARAARAWALVAAGRAEDALDDAQSLAEVDPDNGALGLVYATLGRRDEALAEVSRLTASDRGGGAVALRLAAIHAALGDIKAGCSALARAVDQEALFLGWVRVDPRLDPLRGHACFDEALRRIYDDD